MISDRRRPGIAAMRTGRNVIGNLSDELSIRDQNLPCHAAAARAASDAAREVGLFTVEFLTIYLRVSWIHLRDSA